MQNAWKYTYGLALLKIEMKAQFSKEKCWSITCLLYATRLSNCYWCLWGIFWSVVEIHNLFLPKLKLIPWRILHEIITSCHEKCLNASWELVPRWVEIPKKLNMFTNKFTTSVKEICKVSTIFSPGIRIQLTLCLLFTTIIIGVLEYSPEKWDRFLNFLV